MRSPEKSKLQRLINSQLKVIAMSAKKNIVGLMLVIIVAAFFTYRQVSFAENAPVLTRLASSDLDHNSKSSKASQDGDHRDQSSAPGNDSQHGEEEGHSHGEGDGDDESESQFGEGKAISAVSEGGERFKLAERSTELLGIKAAAIKALSKQTFKIPKLALVRSRADYGVYVVREGWIQLIEVELLNGPRSGEVKILSKKLKQKDMIIVSGLGFVRVAHVQASGKGGEGHDH